MISSKMIYLGKFRGGKRNDGGIAWLPNGDVYEGKWENGK